MEEGKAINNKPTLKESSGPKSNKQKNKLWLWILIGFLILGGLTGLAIFLNRSAQKNKVESSAISYKCDDGFDLQKDKTCLSREAVEMDKLSCSEGELEGDKCVKRETVALNEFCSSGWTKSGNFCNRKVTEDLVTSKNCPAGSDDIGLPDKCGTNRYESTFYTLTCPAGTSAHKLSGHSYCFAGVRDIGHPSYDSCYGQGSLPPTNDRGDYNPPSPGNTCFYGYKFAPRVYACATGEIKFGERACYRGTVSKITSTSCQNGAKQEGSKCVRIEQVGIQKSCPAGFNRNGGQCDKTTTTDAVRLSDCNKEGFRVVDKKCYRHRQAAKSCDEGYKLDGDKCLKN